MILPLSLRFKLIQISQKETSRTALRTEVSLHTRAQSDHWPADIATQAQRADLWRPPRRLESNEIQTIQRIEPRVVFPTPSQPAAWAKKFVTPPGGNIHPKSDPKQGSQPTQGPLRHGGISGLTGMSKSAREKTTSVGLPISAEPQRSLIKTKPVTLFLESSESDKAREETSQFKDPRVSRKRQSTSAKEKTVGNQKLRGRAGSSSPDSRKATKRRKRDRSVVSKLPRAASHREKLGSTSHDDIASSLVDYGSASDSDTSSSEGYTDSQLRRGRSPLFLPKFKSPMSHKKVSSLAKPTTRGEPLFDFEVESGDLFGDGTGGYTDNFPRLGGIGMDTEEVERLIEETDITPVVSDFNNRMPRRVELKTEPETPIEVTAVKQPRSILEIYDDAKKKSIMVYNSRKFRRVLTISVIPDRYSKDPPGPEYLLNKVRGGPLEYVKSFPETHSITFAFIHPADANVFWEFFNKDPDAKECDRRFNVEVNWAQDAIEPLSKLLIDDLIASSASRMIKVYQCPSDKSNIELKAAFCASGPKDGYNEVISVKGKKEKTRRKHNGGLGIVAYVECASIVYASTLSEAIRNNEYEGFNGAEVVYADDPCAFKDGAPNKVDSLRSW